MNRHNVVWGISLTASGIFGLITTSCTEMPDLDELSDLRPYINDVDQDGYKAGDRGRGGDCNDYDPAVNPAAVEVCDGVDNNCDGAIDETLAKQFRRDHDGDGQGDSSETISACSLPDGYVENESDCDDADPLTYEGAEELCDEVDNNCDGLVDNGLVYRSYYLDSDADGFGDTMAARSDCIVPEGFIEQWGDCDDGNPAIHPSATEQCNGIDDDCDDAIDDGLLMPYYRDIDADGYGSGTKDYIISCVPIEGRSINNWDCDDEDVRINPAMPEYCNGIDENCNKLVDEQWWAYSMTPPAYLDHDGDGYGDPGSVFYGCLPPDLGTLTGGDCDDSNPSVNPGAAEACNGLDDDCDGKADEASELPGATCLL